MHILTKFLVVFAAVLSIFLSALTIAYSANADRIVSSLAGAQADAAVARSALQDQNQQFGSVRVRYEDQLQQLHRDLASRDKSTADLQAENSRLLADKNKAESERQQFSGKIAELSELAKTQAALITSYKDELANAHALERKFQGEVVALEAKLSDLESQSEVQSSTIRALNEQLAEVKNGAIGRGGNAGPMGGVGPAAQPFVSTGPVVAARVEQITTDAASKNTLVRINAGTNDQVRENQKFMIVRNGQFLANLVIVQTDLKFSIGRLDTLGKTVQIMEGDTVLSKAN